MDNAILTIIVPLLSILFSMISFIAGQNTEKRKQSMLIKANLLIPIEKWLDYAGRMMSMLGDTVNSVQIGHATPILYNFEERREINQRLSEETNKILGILYSNELRTFSNRKIITKLINNVEVISHILQSELLPLESFILNNSESGKIPHNLQQEVINVNARLNVLLFSSYSYLASIKTRYV